jgi:hypothetical protein
MKSIFSIFSIVAAVAFTALAAAYSEHHDTVGGAPSAIAASAPTPPAIAPSATQSASKLVMEMAGTNQPIPVASLPAAAQSQMSAALAAQHAAAQAALDAAASQPSH